jgi:AcrR family transcriptional regulator
MPRPGSPTLSPRKLPVQERSTQLVADVLEAAIRVLQREGAQRFTTIRVAEEAGVSVGSLYQYFPNKQSILFRLQSDEWKATSAVLERLLADRSKSPRQRLRDTTRAFFRSECDEAPLRSALADAAPVYRDSPQSREQRRRSRQVVSDFLAAAAPRSSPKQRAFAADLMFTTLSAMGKEISERGLSRRRVDAWAEAVADMLLSYLAQLEAS